MKKILIIEDEAQTRCFILECLEAEGFCAMGAEDGLFGVQQVHEQLPDLIICDIMMPKLNGYDVLNTLRQNPITATIPFIFLTGKNSKTELRQGMELGADDYLTKPITVEELLGAIAARLSRQDVLQQWWSSERQQDAKLPATNTTAFATTAEFIPPTVPHLRAVFDFIEANYRQPIALSHVAQAVGYSRAYLTDLVKTHTGKTVNRWIVERRMAEACRLLQNTAQSVEQIAVAVGYQNVGHFFRQFRQCHGTTPRTWRNKNSDSR